MKFSTGHRAALICISFLLGTATACLSADLSLTWDPPTNNTDGSPASDISGYNLYIGSSSGSYSQKINVGNQSSWTVTNLSEGGTYYFAVTAFDSGGTESGYSNEISRTVAVTPAPSEQPTPAPVPAPAPVVGGVSKGDVDGDGVVSMLDVLATLRLVVSTDPMSASNLARADVWPLDANGLPAGDGNVTMGDALAILRRVLKTDSW